MLLRTFKTDKLVTNVYDAGVERGKPAAMEAAAYLRWLLANKEDVYAVFAAAPSQNEFLAELSVASDIAWQRVHALHMDEYVGLSANATQGFGNFLKRSIFDKLPFASVHYIGTEKQPEQACADYEKLISAHEIDVVFMGIGENGHIAFNDPHVARFNDSERVKIVSLDNKCRMQQVHDGCFSTLERVPMSAFTLTIPALIAAKYMFCIVPSKTKNIAVFNTINGPISESCPASILRKKENAILYLDSDSSELLNKSVN